MAAKGKPDYIQSLTPLRGIAALWVVIYHFSMQDFPGLQPDNLTLAIGKGYLAVDLFFMLSGFVITHVYHDAFARAGHAGYWEFLKARIARLYPLHLAILALFVATALVRRAVDYAATGSFEALPVEGARSLGAIAANIAMLQGIKASELSWNYPAWSISLEFLAYLAFPILLPVIWRRGRIGKTLIGLGLATLLLTFAWYTGDDFNQWNGPQALLRCLPEFLIGTLLYAIYRDGIIARALAANSTALVLLGLVAYGLHRGAPDLAMVMLFAILILALVSNHGIVAQALNISPLVWLGNVSYALYLIHGFVQYAAAEALPMLQDGVWQGLNATQSLTAMGLMVAICLILAHLCHHGIEVPGRRHCRKLFGIGTRPAAA